MEDMLGSPEYVGHTVRVDNVQPLDAHGSAVKGICASNDNSCYNGITCHMDNIGTLQNDLNSTPFSNVDLMRMVRKQEMAWESAEAAVEKLERRLQKLEKSETLKTVSPVRLIQEDSPGVVQSPYECDFSGRHCGCHYVSPRCGDLGSNIIYRARHFDDGSSYGLRSKCFNDRLRDDDRDLEIKRLKLLLQKRDLEIQRLRTELQKLRSYEEERNTISDKFVDKVNTIRVSSMPQNYLGISQFPRTESNRSILSGRFSVEDINGFQDMDGSISSCGGTPRRSLACDGLMKTASEKSLTVRTEDTKRSLAVPDQERPAMSPDCSKSNMMIQRTVSAFLSTMQVSLENLCNNLRVRDMKDNDSSKINSGAIEDELFILKKTLSKLAEMCQSSGNDVFSRGVLKHQVENEKNIDGVMQKLAQAESKVVALESSCAEKEKKIEDLENQIHTVLKETESIMKEKYDLTSVVREMYKEAEEQRRRIEELLSINEELLEFSQAKEEKLRNLQEAKDRLMQEVVRYEDNCVAFKSLLQEKDKDFDELNATIKAGEIGTDAMLSEKNKLTEKIQALQKDIEDQKCRNNELVSINEELLEFAQSKEEQLALLSKEVARLQALSELQVQSELQAQSEFHDQLELKDETDVQCLNEVQCQTEIQSEPLQGQSEIQSEKLQVQTEIKCQSEFQRLSIIEGQSELQGVSGEALEGRTVPDLLDDEAIGVLELQEESGGPLYDETPQGSHEQLCEDTES